MGIKAVNSPGPATDKNFVCDFFLFLSERCMVSYLPCN